MNYKYKIKHSKFLKISNKIKIKGLKLMLSNVVNEGESIPLYEKTRPRHDDIPLGLIVDYDCDNDEFTVVSDNELSDEYLNNHRISLTFNRKNFKKRNNTMYFNYNKRYLKRINGKTKYENEDKLISYASITNKEFYDDIDIKLLKKQVKDLDFMISIIEKLYGCELSEYQRTTIKEILRNLKKNGKKTRI